MALSQKHVGKSVVPWFCSEEWKLVYQKIYGPNHTVDTRKEALEILNIWKSRTPFLPRGVEGTFIILNVLLLDRSLYEEYNLQLLFSSSVMRFLNICAVYDKHLYTFYQAAVKINLPEWLINMRHEIAHGQTLPSLEMLDNAIKFCVEWLNNEYWKPVSNDIKDFVDDTEFESDKYDKLKQILRPLVSNYCYITLLMHPYWNFQSVKDIVDQNTKELFLEELNNLASDQPLNESISLLHIQKLLWKNIKLILQDFDDLILINDIIPELLVEEDVFLGKFDERSIVFDNNNAMPTSFLQLWELFLINLQRNDMLGSLIENLLNVVTEKHDNFERQLGASLWLEEIGKGLNKLIFAERWSTSEDERYTLNFDKEVKIPEILKDCTAFKKILLKEPNEYTKIFISEFIDLNDNITNKSQILELIDTYTLDDVEIESMESEAVHVVEELAETPMDTEENEKNSLIKCNDDDSIAEVKDITSEPQQKDTWRKVTEINFEKSPIGILPWQSPDMNPLL